MKANPGKMSLRKGEEFSPKKSNNTGFRQSRRLVPWSQKKEKKKKKKKFKKERAEWQRGKANSPSELKPGVEEIRGEFGATNQKDTKAEPLKMGNIDIGKMGTKGESKGLGGKIVQTRHKPAGIGRGGRKSDRGKKN